MLALLASFPFNKSPVKQQRFNLNARFNKKENEHEDRNRKETTAGVFSTVLPTCWDPSSSKKNDAGETEALGRSSSIAAEHLACCLAPFSAVSTKNLSLPSGLSTTIYEIEAVRGFQADEDSKVLKV